MSGFRISNTNFEPTPKIKPVKSKGMIQLPPLSLLAECVEISPSAPGGLIWKGRPRRHFVDDIGFKFFKLNYAGKPVGGVCGKYYRFSFSYIVDGKQIRTALHNHRVIWAIHNNADPGNAQIDHRDRDKRNNSPLNLRIADPMSNSQNRSVRSDNKSGHTGIRFRSEVNKWLARITVKKRLLTIGYFTTLEEAVEARRNAEIMYFGDFAPEVYR